MRIALITDQYRPMTGGVPTVTHRLATSLAARGHQITIIAPSTSMSQRNWQEEEADGITIRYLASAPWPPYQGQRLALFPISRLRGLLAATMPDVAHIQSVLTLGAAAPLAARTLRIPVIATNHYMPINFSRIFEGAGLLEQGFNRAVNTYMRRLYNACDYVTFPTITAYNLLAAQNLRAPCEVISNGVGLSEFHPGPPDESLRQALGLPSHMPLALTVTRLMREKHVETLLEGLANLRTPLHLAIAGTGPSASALNALASRLGVREHVTFLGYVTDVSLPSLYRLADFFVIASTAELQSLVTLEAMASGLPVIAADAGALPELVDEDQNGYLFPAHDSSRLAARMESLLRQRERWTDMGRRSVVIAARHDAKMVVDRWEAIYRRLAHLSTTRQTPVMAGARGRG